MSANFPFIPREKIEEIAENFRGEFWNSPPPVNPFTVWEHRKNHHIDLLLNLRDRTSVEAYLILEYDTIVLDEGMYLRSKPLRLNFSMAHEIGHYALHHRFLRSDWAADYNFHPATAAIWKLQLKEFDPFAYNRAETQANMFASYFLMPTSEILASYYNLSMFLHTQGKGIETFASNFDDYRQYVSAILAEEFKVSKPAMLNRLNELKVWDKKFY